MKSIIRLFLFLTVVSTRGQFIDNFSDGDFAVNPTWTGDADKFSIVFDQLKLAAPPAAGSAYLSTPSEAINDATWEYWVRMEFNPSSTNLAKVYVVSDEINLAGAVHGYFVLIGGSSDEVSLYRQTGNTTLKIIDGLDGRVNASLVTAKVKVTRDQQGNWALFSDVNATGTYQLEGTAIDDTHKVSSYFGVMCEYTATRADKFFFDDFVVTGSPFRDLDPPQLVGVTILSSTVLAIGFDEPLDVSSANDNLNYSLDLGIGNPTQSDLEPDMKSVKLILSQPLQNGKTYRLNVNGVSDVNGNAMSNGTTNFLYFEPVAPSARDLIFTEIFADPSPVVSLPAVEYLEILNRSTNPFDLAGWQLSDGTSTATFNAQLVQPGDYWVVTASASVSLFGTAVNVIGLSNFPTLNNSGDLLVLKSPGGLTIDSISYTLSWYHDEDKQEGGWALELINPEDVCHLSENWSASVNETGGTPGLINSIFSNAQDTQGPKLTSLVALSPYQIQLNFDERLHEDVFSTLMLTANPSLVVQSMSFMDEALSRVLITLATPLEKQVLYSVTANGVFDCSGNEVSSEHNRATFYFLQDAEVRYKDVIITEIMADPEPTVDLPAVEYLEILNRTDKPLDLAGWSLFDDTGAAVLPSAILLAKSYLILTAKTSVLAFHPSLPVVGVNNFPTINNSGESLVLKSPHGLTIDSLKFNTTWYRDIDKQQGGWSLEIIDPENPCGEEDNWAASEGVTGGTPGAVNSINGNKPDLTGPSLLTVKVLDSVTLLLTFNEKLDKHVADQAQVSVDPPLAIQSLESNEALREITVHLNEPLLTKQLYTVTFSGIVDCNGNPLADGDKHWEFAVPEIANPGELVINEILFNPRPNGVDFIELWNLSEKFVTLKLLHVADKEPDSNTLDRLLDSDYIVKPGGFVVLTAEPDKLANEYPKGDLSSFVKADLPSLPDQEGKVVVINQEGELLDLLSYDKDFHSPLIRDPEGISLERISPHAPNAKENWRSATAAAGFATPGLVNSNFVVASQALLGEIAVEPEIIAPTSGLHHYAQIRYQFDQPGLAASVKIFDQQGRLIKTLANNEIISAHGFFRWDGDQDDGTRARLGYYFVWFEIFGTDGITKTYRKRVVVAAR